MNYEIIKPHPGMLFWSKIWQDPPVFVIAATNDVYWYMDRNCVWSVPFYHFTNPEFEVLK